MKIINRIAPLLSLCVLAITGFQLCCGPASAEPAKFTLLHTFLPNGLYPEGRFIQYGLVEGTDGDCYGTTSGGGSSGYGTLFRISPAGVVTTIYEFTEGPPSGPLFLSSDSNFYGTTYLGNGEGTVYCVSPEGSFRILHAFAGPDGGFPLGGVIQASDGNFYGTATSGGAYNHGVVFRVSKGGAFSVIHSFNGIDGDDPEAGLIQGKDFNLYGTCAGVRPTVDNSTAFRISLSGDFDLLRTFKHDDGTVPRFGLIQASDSNFYGVAPAGGAFNQGTLFRFSPSGVFTKLYDFPQAAGLLPNGGLAQGPDGKLYGLCKYYGDPSNPSDGSVYSSTLSGAVTQIYNDTNGLLSPPSGTPAFAADGSLYCSFFNGIVNLSVSGAESVVHVFGTTEIADGSTPHGPLVFGSDGKLYGVASGGGDSGFGTIFSIATDGSSYAQVHSFGVHSPTDNGLVPLAGLTKASDGNFYGTTSEGGQTENQDTLGYGSVFRLTPLGDYSTLYSFNTDGSQTKGGYPNTRLLQASDGILYGTTGGTYDSAVTFPSTIYKVTPSGGFAVEHLFPKFAGPPTQYGLSSLMQASDGKLYCTAQSGPPDSQQGSLYSLSLAGAFAMLHNFGGSNAPLFGPTSSLIQGANGLLYGGSQSGGGFGSIYSSTFTGTISSLFDFPEGGFGPFPNPISPLIQGGNSDFYGTSSIDGPSYGGVLFRVSPRGIKSNVLTFAQGQGTSDGLTLGPDGALYGIMPGDLPTGFDNGEVFKVTLPPTDFDFNGDGHADLLWQNQLTGAILFWNMNDWQVLSYGSIAAETGDPAWKVVASVDDRGVQMPDLLLWNSSTGQLEIWQLDHETVTVKELPFAQVADTTWQPVAVGDVDGNGGWTLIWQNKLSGQILNWYMFGASVVQHNPTYATLDPAWHVVGAPDMDRDGFSDLLLWNSASGQVSIWHMEGDTIVSKSPVIATVSDTDWHLVGAPDTNDDGAPDLLWENVKTGQVTRWLMDDTTVLQYGQPFASVADTNWHISGMK